MYRDTGWNGVQCTINGEFKRGCRAINTRNNDYWWYIRITINGKSYEKGCLSLIRAAWKDAIERGEVPNKEIKKIGKFITIQDALFELKPVGMYDLWCTKNGIFKRGDHFLTLTKSKTILGYKKRAYITISVNGERKQLTVDKLIARAWFPTIYKDDLRILYKDKDLWNLHIDNLIFCKEENFLKLVNKDRGRQLMTIDDSKEILDRMIYELTLQRNYIDTRDFTDITKYIQQSLYNRVLKYTKKVLGNRIDAEMCASDVIASLYERIANKRPLYDWWKYVRIMVANFKKYGESVDRWLQPEIKNEVEQLKIKAYETKQFV